MHIFIFKITPGETKYEKATTILENINNFSFKPNITYNDFIKINNERLAFVSTTESTNKLYILIFDLYDNYANIKIRTYNYDLSHYSIDKELAIFEYNGYLVFSSTVKSTLSTLDFFSIFILFGYPIWEGNIIEDISLYLTDIDSHDPSNNIISKLNEGLRIENNIFGYIPANKIKLISIPNEIIFYNGEETTKLSNGDILEFNHRFLQNSNLLKNNQYYSFDFQIIIQEPDYDTFYNFAHSVINIKSGDQINNYKQNTFMGRINTVKFKLCHDYCATCKTLGNSNDDQQCMSCLSPYIYDYFNEYPSNCVPSGYFNDKEQKKLVECTPANSKYYVDTSNNKRICFKLAYDCPDEYPY